MHKLKRKGFKAPVISAAEAAHKNQINESSSDVISSNALQESMMVETTKENCNVHSSEGPLDSEKGTTAESPNKLSHEPSVAECAKYVSEPVKPEPDDDEDMISSSQNEIFSTLSLTRLVKSQRRIKNVESEAMFSTSVETNAFGGMVLDDIIKDLFNESEKKSDKMVSPNENRTKLTGSIDKDLLSVEPDGNAKENIKKAEIGQIGDVENERGNENPKEKETEVINVATKSRKRLGMKKVKGEKVTKAVHKLPEENGVKEKKTKKAKSKKEQPEKEKPVKEKPVKEKPVKEKPVKEKPEKEKPEKEKPVKEKPEKEKPVKEKPEKEKSKKNIPRKTMKKTTKDKTVNKTKIEDVSKLDPSILPSSMGGAGGSSGITMSQPPKHLRHVQRLQWLQVRRGHSTWVRCDRPACNKWRHVVDERDPSVLPHKWYCEMNPDPSMASCAVPEVPPTPAEELDMVDGPWFAGSLVWAHLTGYPWWPAMVDDCPDTEQYYWLNIEHSDQPIYYNVVFFDSVGVTRAWVEPNALKNFTSPIPPGNRKGTKFRSRINFGVQMALKALTLGVPGRLKNYSFLAQYKGEIITPPKSSSGSDSDISLMGKLMKIGSLLHTQNSQRSIMRSKKRQRSRHSCGSSSSSDDSDYGVVREYAERKSTKKKIKSLKRTDSVGKLTEKSQKRSHSKCSNHKTRKDSLSSEETDCQDLFVENEKESSTENSHKLIKKTRGNSPSNSDRDCEQSLGKSKELIEKLENLRKYNETLSPSEPYFSGSEYVPEDTVNSSEETEMSVRKKTRKLQKKKELRKNDDNSANKKNELYSGTTYDVTSYMDTDEMEKLLQVSQEYNNLDEKNNTICTKDGSEIENRRKTEEKITENKNEHLNEHTKMDVEIIEPEKGTESSKMIEPENGTESSKMIEPENGTESSKMIEPENETKSSKMIEPENGTESSTMIEPENETESSKIIEPESGTKSSKMIEPENGTESSKMIEPENETKSSKMAELPTESTDCTLIYKSESEIGLIQSSVSDLKDISDLISLQRTLNTHPDNENANPEDKPVPPTEETGCSIQLTPDFEF